MDKDKLMMEDVVILDKDLLKNIKGRGGDGDEDEKGDDPIGMYNFVVEISGWLL